MNVLIAHPTRQHSHRLARALNDEGLLHSYWTLLPEKGNLSWLPDRLVRLLPSVIQRHSLGFMPSDKVHVFMGPLVLHKITSKLRWPSVQLLGELVTWKLFDRWIARNLSRHRPDVIVGFEMCCSDSFKEAKRLGITCMLDAAAVHYEFQDSILHEADYGTATWAGKYLRERKRQEIDLADHILCVSKFARQSYIDAGIESRRITVNEVGCDVARFSAFSNTPRKGPVKFVFIGVPLYHKGFDILLAAFCKIASTNPVVELHVIGDESLIRGLPKGCDEKIKCHGKLSHDLLPSVLSSMDCLVLPSRLESFGMVVVEALAAGVPVIVSDHVGAAQAITEGKNGWVVSSEDKVALADRMLSCCLDIDNVRRMQHHCKQSAVPYDWSSYSSRVIDYFQALSSHQ